MDDVQFKHYLSLLYKYIYSKLEFTSNPMVILKKDLDNSKNFFGKTGYYDPENDTIALYITGRHPKDILRTFSHECIHRQQYLKNLFNIKNETDLGPNYAQKSRILRRAEGDAYLRGNLTFRDWEDSTKNN